MNAPGRRPDTDIQVGLAAHLDHVRATTDLSGPAIARAHGIRRRRRAVAGVTAALAVAAVTAPLVWWNARGTTEVVTPATTSPTSLPSTPAPTSTSPAPTTTSTATAVPTGDADVPRIRVTVDPQAPLASRPDVPHLLDSTLHQNGVTRSFVAHVPFSYIPLSGGRSLLVESGAGRRALVVESDGGVRGTIQARPGHHLFATANVRQTRFTLYESSLQGSEPTATLRVFDDRGTELARKDKVLTNLRVVGFIDDRVFIGNSDVNHSYVWDLGRNIIDRYTDEGVVGAVNELTGRAAFYHGPGRDEKESPDAFANRCTVVSDVRGDTPVPVSATCGTFQPRALSADGRYLLGVESPADGMLQPPSRVIDVATGRAVISFDEERPLDMDSAFLPDGSVVLNLVLAPDAGNERNTLLRCTLEGSCTRLVETIEMPDFGTTMVTRYRIPQP